MTKKHNNENYQLLQDKTTVMFGPTAGEPAESAIPAAEKVRMLDSEAGVAITVVDVNNYE